MEKDRRKAGNPVLMELNVHKRSNSNATISFKQCYDNRVV